MAMYNFINETMLEQEFRSLEPFRQILLVVSLITRGPANPIRASLFCKNNITERMQLAITPAIVGLVKIEMKGTLGRIIFARAALVLPIALNLKIPSYLHLQMRI